MASCLSQLCGAWAGACRLVKPDPPSRTWVAGQGLLSLGSRMRAWPVLGVRVTEGSLSGRARLPHQVLSVFTPLKAWGYDAPEVFLKGGQTPEVTSYVLRSSGWRLASVWTCSPVHEPCKWPARGPCSRVPPCLPRSRLVIPLLGGPKFKAEIALRVCMAREPAREIPPLSDGLGNLSIDTYSTFLQSFREEEKLSSR